MKTLSTETILTHPKCFGLVTASPLQRAICRMSDGLPLEELATEPAVIRAFGGEAAIRALPVGERPVEIHILGAIRGAKSLMAAAKIVELSGSVDVSHVSRGDIVRIGALALKLENTRAVMSHLSANGTTSRLRPLFVGTPTEGGATLLHPSSVRIETSPLPLDRAGASLQSTWLAGAVIDEEPRMIGAEGGVKNWDHARDSILGRLLSGAQLFGIGSAWAPFGPIFDLVSEFFGRPSRDLVIVRAPGPDLNPKWWTPKRCEDLRRRNPVSYRTDVLCEFADVEEALNSAAEIEAVTRAAPMELDFDPKRTHIAVIDPAAKKNAFVLEVISIELRPDGMRHYRVCLARQWVPKGKPLDLEAVWSEIRDLLKPFGIQHLATDQFSVTAMATIANRYDLDLIEHTVTAAGKLDMFTTLATLISAKQIELSPDTTLRSDLLSVRRRTTQAGVAIHIPTTADGRHGDFAAALALGVFVASEAGVPQQRRREWRGPSDSDSRYAGYGRGFY